MAVLYLIQTSEGGCFDCKVPGFHIMGSGGIVMYLLKTQPYWGDAIKFGIKIIWVLAGLPGMADNQLSRFYSLMNLKKKK